MKTLRTLSLLSLALLISVPAVAMDIAVPPMTESEISEMHTRNKGASSTVDIDALGSGEDDASSQNSAASGASDASDSSDNTSSDEPAISDQDPKRGFFARAFNSFTGAAKATGSAVGNSAIAVYNKTLKPYSQEQLDARAKNNTEWADAIDDSTKTGAAKKWSAEQYAKTNRFFANHKRVTNGLYYTGLGAVLAATLYGVKKTYDWIKSKWSKKSADEQLIVAANTALTEKKPCVVDALCGMNIQDDIRDQLVDRAVAIDQTIAALKDADNKEDIEDFAKVAQVQVDEFNTFVKANLSSKSTAEASDVSADNNCGSCKK